ncbi:hypothetical protein FA15DRAFT_707771 [Coprinopsis marcescibilis]|uniref:Uncharacterized protein n=1 Tax=Coprinopsis marcescibilis TaxID=230819 RepID=A0A5C3KKW1_COPMA|nr:hypothetical protein FA15DRAFT_707771 [Coprinopsis marcescibilis]
MPAPSQTTAATANLRIPPPTPLKTVVEMLQNLVISTARLGKKHHALTDRVAALQAGQILNEVYCGKLWKQLALKEATKKPNPGAGRILGDGLPHMLTGDTFVDQVWKSAEAQKEKEAEADMKTQAKQAWIEAVKAWEEMNEEIDAAKEEHKQKVTAWEKKRDGAKAKKTRFSL